MLGTYLCRYIHDLNVIKIKLQASLRSSVARPFAALRGASFLSPAPGNFPVPLRRTIELVIVMKYGRDEAPKPVRRPRTQYNYIIYTFCR